MELRRRMRRGPLLHETRRRLAGPTRAQLRRLRWSIKGRIAVGYLSGCITRVKKRG